MANQNILVDLKKLNAGRFGLTAAAMFMFIGQFFLVLAGTLPNGPYDGFVQLVPWIFTSAILLFSYWASARVGLGLLCAAVAMMANLAFNFLLAVPTLVGNSRIVWDSGSPAYLGTGFSKTELSQIANGDKPLIVLGDVFLWVGSILALLFSIVIFVGLRRFLSGPARKTSFSIDITMLLVLLIGAVAAEFYMKYSWIDAYSTSTLSFLLMTYLPLLLWLAFTLRQGGVVSIGSASGLVGAVFLVPVVMGLLTIALGGSSARYVTEDGNIAGSRQNAYDVFNPMGVFSSVIVVSLVLMLIVLWWNFGIFSQYYVEERVAATTSSSVNSLSVVAFILSWIPLTSIPANILGHMAYDQVLHDPNQQRGLGLSRAAIILSYLSLATVGFAIYTIWFN